MSHNKFCVIPSCESCSADPNKNYGLHHFPSDPDRCREWIEFVKQLDPSFNGLHLRHKLLCSYHFKATCFKPQSRYPGDGKTATDGGTFVLHTVAVPTEKAVNSNGLKRRRLHKVRIYIVESWCIFSHYSPATVQLLRFHSRSFGAQRSLKRKIYFFLSWRRGVSQRTLNGIYISPIPAPFTFLQQSRDLPS